MKNLDTITMLDNVQREKEVIKGLNKLYGPSKALAVHEEFIIAYRGKNWKALMDSCNPIDWYTHRADLMERYAIICYKVKV